MKGWTAPEVDRLVKVGESDIRLMIVGGKLRSRNPEQRPSLLDSEWRRWLAALPSDVLKTLRDGIGRKDKAAVLSSARQLWTWTEKL
jgi:hypothetical protein